MLQQASSFRLNEFGVTQSIFPSVLAKKTAVISQIFAKRCGQPWDTRNLQSKQSSAWERGDTKNGVYFSLPKFFTSFHIFAFCPPASVKSNTLWKTQCSPLKPSNCFCPKMCFCLSIMKLYESRSDSKTKQYFLLQILSSLGSFDHARQKILGKDRLHFGAKTFQQTMTSDS